MGLIDRARELAERTPPQRNRYVDFLRAASILVVVLGHWLMAVISVQEGHVRLDHLLARVPWTQLLTWVLQVMPVFFLVGAYSNAASWQAATRSGQGYAGWLRARCQRLLGPTAVFALAWVPLALLSRRIVPDDEVLVLFGRFVAVPLWFLAVYLLVIPLAPAMFSLHRRAGIVVPVALTLAAGALDLIDMHLYPSADPFRPSFGWLNYLLVWLAVHQLGFFWWDGSLERVRAIRWWLIAVGLGVMIALTASGLYPLSMIGVPGTGRTNNTPPSVILVFLALFQLGCVLVSTAAARRWLARTEVWARTIVVNSMIMTMYLWHLTALVVTVFTGLALGLRFPIRPLSGLWWWSRLGWIALLALVLTAFVAAFGRFERPGRGAPPPGGRWAAALAFSGALLAAAALAGLALQGFYRPGEPWGLPLGTLVLLLGGAAVLGVGPGLYLRGAGARS